MRWVACSLRLHLGLLALALAQHIHSLTAEVAIVEREAEVIVVGGQSRRVVVRGGAVAANAPAGDCCSWVAALWGRICGVVAGVAVEKGEEGRVDVGISEYDHLGL
jgi:hypothetical protein